MEISTGELVQDINNIIAAAGKLAHQARQKAIQYHEAEAQIATQSFRDMILREGIKPQATIIQ